MDLHPAYRSSLSWTVGGGKLSSPSITCAASLAIRCLQGRICEPCSSTCLNSRPLYVISDDAADYNSGYNSGAFFSGRKPGDDAGARSRIKYLELINRLRDEIWRRSKREYLHHLQQLGKWRGKSANLKMGILILLKDNDLSAIKWAMGRITEMHPGDDGMVRMVTVQTADSRFRRPITRVFPLQVQETESQNNVD